LFDGRDHRNLIGGRGMGGRERGWIKKGKEE
jgi:hypothetical protein